MTDSSAAVDIFAKFDALQSKAERMLDRTLTLRENVNNMAIRLELTYKPILQGTFLLNPEVKDIMEEECSIYYKCQPMTEKINILLTQLRNEYSV